MLFAGRFAVGLGAAVTFIGALKIATAWFPPERFGVISAVTATVGVPGRWWRRRPGRAGGAARMARRLLSTGAATIVCRALPGARAQRARRRQGAAVPSLRAVLRGMRRVLANPHTWPPFLAFFCLYSAVANLYLWAVPYLRDVHGQPTTRAA